MVAHAGPRIKLRVCRIIISTIRIFSPGPEVSFANGLTVTQMSVAADANIGQPKGLVKAVGTAESNVTQESLC